MSKLGFTFYPKDWWTSDTFFELEPIERYIYLECLFVMYKNDGFLRPKKELLEKRLLLEIKPNSWEKITQMFILTDLGYTSKTVNGRLKKSVSNRLNGKKGGRPKGSKTITQNNPNNPPLEREREREYKENINKNIHTKFAHLKLTKKEHEKLCEKYSDEEINEVLDSIKNYRKNTNYKSLYLTSLKWLKKNRTDGKINTTKTAATYSRSDSLGKLHN